MLNVSDSDSQTTQPCGDLIIRCLAMPRDTNPQGDVFGGWVLSQMDIAGGVFCKRKAHGRVVTVSVEKMSFYLPMMVGDLLCCYVNAIKVGKTSMQVKIEAWVEREFEDHRFKVTEGFFTYVAVDNARRPRPIPKD